MSLSNNNNNRPHRMKDILSRLIKASPTPPQLLFLAILGVYYHFLSTYQQENSRRRVVDGVLVAYTPSAEAQLTKARYDFYFFVAMGASFAFSALYYGADMFSGLWALVDAASPPAVGNPSAKHISESAESESGTASDPDVSESDAAASQGHPSRARKAAVNAALALPASVMGVYAGWIRYERQVEELQTALIASAV